MLQLPLSLSRLTTVVSVLKNICVVCRCPPLFADADDKSKSHLAVNGLNAKPIVDFVCQHLEQKYPQQKRFHRRDDPQLLRHSRCLVKRPSVSAKPRLPGSSTPEAFGGSHMPPASPTTSTTTVSTPRSGSRGKGSAPEVLVHSQVFVHGLHVEENFHSTALVQTAVKPFAGVVMLPGEYLVPPGTSATDNRLRYAIANGVAAQWFGCWVDVSGWIDAWLQVCAISLLL